MLVNIFKLSNDIDKKNLYVYQNTNENENLKYNCYIEIMVLKTLKYYMDYKKQGLTRTYIKTILINMHGEIYTDDNIFIDPNTYFSLL